MDSQCVPDSPRIPGDNVKGTLEAFIKCFGELRKGNECRASGSTCENWISGRLLRTEDEVSYLD